MNIAIKISATNGAIYKSSPPQLIHHQTIPPHRHPQIVSSVAESGVRQWIYIYIYIYIYAYITQWRMASKGESRTLLFLKPEDVFLRFSFWNLENVPALKDLALELLNMFPGTADVSTF